jgi:hypothetical protein
MARQTFYLAKDVKHPLYKTRMLQAGPLELDASAARLYRRLGVDLSDEAPKRAAPAAKPAPVIDESIRSTVETVPTPEEAPKPAAKKAPAKKAARRKKS